MIPSWQSTVSNFVYNRLAWTWWLIAAALIALGIWARLTNLDGAYWFDELIGVKLAQMPWQDFWRTLQLENHPPLYYLLIRGWTQWFALSETSLRTLSALIGIMAIAAFFLVGRIFGGRRVAVMAAALSASSTIMIFYSREARMYSPVILFSVLSFGTFWLWLKSQRTTWAMLNVVIMTMGMFSHYSFFIVVVSEAIFFLIDRPHHNARLRTGALMVTPTMFLVGIWVFFQYLSRIVYPIGLPTWYTGINLDPWSATSTFSDLLLFQSVPAAVLPHVSAGSFFIFRPLAIWSLLGLAAWPVAQTFWRRWQGSISFEQRRISLLLALPIVIGFLTSFVTRVAVAKYYLPSASALVFLAALGFVRLRAIRPALSLSALCIIFLVHVIWIPALVYGQRYPWREVGVLIADKQQPGDSVLVHSWINTVTFREYYHSTLPAVGIFPLDTPDDPSSYSTIVRYVNRRVITPQNIGPWMERTTRDAKRVWFVNENNNQFFNGQLVPRWFLSHGWVIAAMPSVPRASADYLTLFERGDTFQ